MQNMDHKTIRHKARGGGLRCFFITGVRFLVEDLFKIGGKSAWASLPGMEVGDKLKSHFDPELIFNIGHVCGVGM